MFNQIQSVRRRLRIANSGILAKPTNTNEEEYTVLLRTLLISPYKGVIHILSDPISFYDQVFSASTSFHEDLLCINSSSYCGLLVRFSKNCIIGWHKQTFVSQGSHCDLTILGTTSNVQCHRLVMASLGIFLKDLVKDSTVDCLILPETSPHEINCLLNLAYAGK